MHRILASFRAISCILVFGLATNSHAQDRLAPPLQTQKQAPIKHESAETLYSITKAEFSEDGHWTRRVYHSIRINDIEAARDYGRITIRFNHYYSDLELDFANTIGKSNKVESLADDALQRRVTGGGQDFYSDSSELVFSLPDIAPGSILEFQYTHTSKELAFPELYSDGSSPFWFQSTVGGDGWRADYVHNYSYELTHPKVITVHQSSYSGYPSKAKKSNVGDKSVLTWSMRDVQPIRSESWMPEAREFIPGLRLSTIRDWKKLDAWSWAQIEDKLPETDELKVIVNSLNLPKHASNEEKVRAVYQYLQTNVRYVFAHLGRGGYEPHFPTEVVEASYGDCKDQSVLGVALLRLLGVEAYPALVETAQAGRSNTDLVALFFDHMIIYIPESQNVSSQWIDTTGDRSLYPGISNYLSEQNAFIVNGQGGQLSKFPVMDQNLATLNLSFSKQGDSELLVKANIVLQGYYEQNIRGWWKHTNDQDNELNQYLTTLFNNANIDISGDVINEDDLWKPTEINAEFVMSNEEESTLFGAGIQQLFRLFANNAALPLPDSRMYNFVDNYPYKLQLRATFKGTDTESPAVIQSESSQKLKYFDIAYSGELKDNDYYLNIDVSRPSLNLSPVEYSEYYAETETIARSNPWLIALIENTSQRDSDALVDARDNFGMDSAEYLVQSAKILIDEGKFEEALAPALKAVELQNNNGEAWYVLGMAQGFNTLIEESSASFEKAEQFGYLP